MTDQPFIDPLATNASNSTEARVKAALAALSAAGYTIGAPDRISSDWTTWNGFSRRGANDCANALRKAGFKAFANKDTFGFRTFDFDERRQ